MNGWIYRYEKSMSALLLRTAFGYVGEFKLSKHARRGAVRCIDVLVEGMT